ncbi:Shattered, partial [Operophtera brumata]
MTEVFNILQSSQPVTINLTQRPEVSDHDFIEEQEKYLYALSTRTMALPGTTEMSPEHSGFLMALGLNGHLRDMPFMNMYEYLVKCNEMLSVGLLLGLAATYRGTMDIQATKLMSIHLEPLLPPTSIELDIQQNILVAALLGSLERRALRGARGLRPRSRPRARHAASGRRQQGAHTDSQRDRHKNSNGVEGGTINLDVTSPGATLALGLVYMRSGAAAPASWLQPPRTPYELDFVRPDLLMLRVIARGLILWDDIEASDEWIKNQVPDTIRPQAYCNIIAGACFAMGIRFAGSGDEDARDSALSMAVHMCVGLLFLMGGRGTLGTSRAAVAALLAAYHLQAFRHLYVLAVEPRLLLPRDLNTGKLCYAHIQVIDLKGVTIELKAPCMIPELSTLQEVKINDPRYWPVSFHRHNNWDLLKRFLELTWCIDVKQRAGCLSYVDDPQGFLTILAQTLTLDKSNIWSAKPDYIQLFTNDDKIRNFVKHYLNNETNENICADCLIISKKRKG